MFPLLPTLLLSLVLIINSNVGGRSTQTLQYISKHPIGLMSTILLQNAIK